jgi:hypothetical protein
MSLTKATNRMINGAPANVKDYGAVGDGVTDDTAAFNLVFSTFSDIYIPEGEYRINSTLTGLQGRQGVNVSGAFKGDDRLETGYGGGTTLSYYGSDACINLDNDGDTGGNTRTYFIKISNISIRNKGTGTTTKGIYVEDSGVQNFHGSLYFDNISIYSFDHGIYCDYVGWIFITACSVQYCGWGFYGQVNVLRIEQSAFTANSRIGFDASAAKEDITARNSGGGVWVHNCTAVTLSSVDMEGQAIGFKSTGTTYANLTGCYFEGHTHMAAFAAGLTTFDNCYSANNFDATYQDLFVIESRGATFTGCRGITAVNVSSYPLTILPSGTVSQKRISSNNRADWDAAPDEYNHSQGLDEKYLYPPRSNNSSFKDIAEQSFSVTATATNTLNTNVAYNPLGRNSRTLYLAALTDNVRTRIIAGTKSIGDYVGVSLLMRGTPNTTQILVMTPYDVGDGSVCGNGGAPIIRFDVEGLAHVKIYFYVKENTAGDMWLYFTTQSTLFTFELLGLHVTEEYEDFTLPTAGAMYGSGAPSAGYYDVGSKVWDTTPSAGGTMGWVCITAGTPGTWKTFGAITA